MGIKSVHFTWFMDAPIIEKNHTALKMNNFKSLVKKPRNLNFKNQSYVASLTNIFKPTLMEFQGLFAVWVLRKVNNFPEIYVIATVA